MNTNRSMAWLREAVGGIKYPPDRRRVEKELYAHVMQRNRDFLKEGCTEREADEKACAAMGDPVEVRRDLAAIHRPFWGYATLILRILVVCIFLLALGYCLLNSQKIAYAFSPLVDGEKYSVEQWMSQSSVVKCGDYTLRLKKAAWAEEKETGESCLLLELEYAHLDPFLGSPWFSIQPQLEDSRGLVFPVHSVNNRELVFTGRYLWKVSAKPGAVWAILTVAGPDGAERLTVRLEVGSA